MRKQTKLWVNQRQRERERERDRETERDRDRETETEREKFPAKNSNLRHSLACSQNKGLS